MVGVSWKKNRYDVRGTIGSFSKTTSTQGALVKEENVVRLRVVSKGQEVLFYIGRRKTRQKPLINNRRNV